MFRESIVAVDLETGGLVAGIHPILTLAMVTITKEGEIVNPLNLSIKYDNYDNVEEAALAKNGINLEEHDKIATPWNECQEIINVYIRDACYNPDTGKKHAARFLGHNVGFDLDHLSHFQSNFSDLSFRGAKIDTQSMVNDLYVRGIIDCRFSRLEKICGYYDIPILAHDALSDIMATAELYLHLINLEEKFYYRKLKEHHDI